MIYRYLYKLGYNAIIFQIHFLSFVLLNVYDWFSYHKSVFLQYLAIQFTVALSFNNSEPINIESIRQKELLQTYYAKSGKDKRSICFE